MLQKFSEHRLVTALSMIALALILGGFVWAFLELRIVAASSAGTSLILHFNDIDGITSVGGLGTIWFMGAFGVLVAIMNFFVALEFDARDQFLGKFLASLTLVFAVLLFIAFAAIISVNV
jgi:hypothetical protein